MTFALLAQLDRVFGYEPKGQGFESLTARQKRGIPIGYSSFLFKRAVRDEKRTPINARETSGDWEKGPVDLSSSEKRVPPRPYSQGILFRNICLAYLSFLFYRAVRDEKRNPTMPEQSEEQSRKKTVWWTVFWLNSKIKSLRKSGGLFFILFIKCSEHIHC